MDMVTLGKSCIDAARKALKEISEIVMTKDGINVQTNADIQSHKAIIACLENSGLQCDVYSEESEDVIKLNGGNSNLLWILDPIDNTHLYLRNEFLFCSVAIMVLENETPTYAFIGDLNNQDIYHCDSKQSYLNDKKITVPENTPGRNLIMGWAPYKMRAERFFKHLLPLSEKDNYIYNIGGQLQAVKIATGHYDAYVEVRAETINEMCAALIVQRAGGWVTTLQGNPLQLKPGFKQSLIIARTEKLHSEIKSAFQNVNYED